MAVGNMTKSIGAGMTKFVTVPLMGMAGLALKIGGDFEEQMSRVKAISGATGDAFEALREQAIDLGASTAFSAKEAAAGMENLASAGFSAQEIMEAMPGLLDLAAVSGGDVGMAAEYASSTLRGFNIAAEDAGHVADVFARAAADTNAEVVDMGYAMKYVAPVASAMGISLEETAAAIGIMSDAGIKGSQAGTTLRGALARIAKPTKAMKETMDELGLSFYDSEGNMISLESQIGMLQGSFDGLTQEQRNNALVTLYGQNSLSGMMALVDKGPDALSKLTTSLEQSDGAADEMARTMQDNMKASIEQMMGAFESAAIIIQQIFAPAVRTVADFVANMVDKFVSAPESMQRFIVILGVVVAAIGPLLLVGGTLLIWFMQLKVALMVISALLAAAGTSIMAVVGTVFFWVTAIVAVIAAIMYLWNTNETFRNVVIAIWNAIVAVIMSVVNAIVSFVMEIWGMLVDWWGENNEAILTIATTIWNAIMAVINYVLNLILPIVQAVWNGVKNLTENAWNLIKSVIKTALQLILDWVSVLLAVFTGDWEAAWNKIKDMFSNAWDGIVDIFKSTLDLISNIFTEAGNTFFESGKALVRMIADGISAGISWVTDAIGGVVQAARNFLPFSPAKEGPLSDLDKLNFGGTIADGIYKGQSQVTKAMDRILQIPSYDDYALGLGGSMSTSVQHSLSDSQVNRPLFVTVQSILDGKVLVDETAPYMATVLDSNASKTAYNSGFRR